MQWHFFHFAMVFCYFLVELRGNWDFWMKRRTNNWIFLYFFDGTCNVKKLWTLLSRTVFDAPHHPYHGGEVHVTKRSTVELQSDVFFPHSYLLFFLEKYVGHCKKKKNKEVWVFICWVKWGLYYFNCNVFNLESFIDFFLISFLYI